MECCKLGRPGLGKHPTSPIANAGPIVSIEASEHKVLAIICHVPPRSLRCCSIQPTAKLTAVRIGTSRDPAIPMRPGTGSRAPGRSRKWASSACRSVRNRCRPDRLPALALRRGPGTRPGERRCRRRSRRRAGGWRHRRRTASAAVTALPGGIPGRVLTRWPPLRGRARRRTSADGRCDAPPGGSARARRTLPMRWDGVLSGSKPGSPAAYRSIPSWSRPAVAVRKASDVREVQGVWADTTIVAPGPATSLIACSSVAGPPSTHPIALSEQCTSRSWPGSRPSDREIGRQPAEIHRRRGRPVAGLAGHARPGRRSFTSHRPSPAPCRAFPRRSAPRSATGSRPPASCRSRPPTQDRYMR